MKNSCIVGYGAVGPIHAEAVASAENAALYAVCDSNRERLDICGKRHEVLCYESYDDVLKDKNIDVVHICTPHYLHKDMTVAAMLAGKDVVLEKPAAMNREELDEICCVKAQTGRRVCLMLQNRTNAAVAEFKKAAADISLGRLVGIEGSMMWYRSAEYYNSAQWRGTWKYEGGGVLINQAVHLIDLFGYLGGEIKTVRASISTKNLSDAIEVEDTADALLEMANGVRACFYAVNTYTSNKPFRLEFEFENGLLRYADNRLYRITDSVEIVACDDSNTLGKKYWGTGHKRVIDRFYDSFENKGSFISLEDGLNTMRALFAFYESAGNNGKETAV